MLILIQNYVLKSVLVACSLTIIQELACLLSIVRIILLAILSILDVYLYVQLLHRVSLIMIQIYVLRFALSGNSLIILQ